MGDTGVGHLCRTACLGARSNFEGGPSALAAALTGRTPRYGYHLDECRRATRRFQLAAAPRDLGEWGALGGIVGRGLRLLLAGAADRGLTTVPGSDALKHFGAALASYGSVALFHMPGITAEEAVFAGSPPERRPDRSGPRSRPSWRAYGAAGRQGRRRRLRRAAAVARSRSRRWRTRSTGASSHPGTTLHRRDLARDQARRRPHGADRPHRGVGRASSPPGICFYQSYAGEMAEAKRLDAPDDQLGEARQHHRRLRLPVEPGEPRALRRLGGRREGAVDADLACAATSGIGPAVTGTALVAADNFSARYDLDRKPRDLLAPEPRSSPAQSYADRILVLDGAKGGVATAWMLRDMKARGDRAAGADLQPGQPDPGARRGLRRRGAGRPLRRAT